MQCANRSVNQKAVSAQADLRATGRRFACLGGERCREILGAQQRRVPVFVEAAKDETCPQLATDLRLKGMAELHRAILVDTTAQLLGGKMLQIRVGKRKTHHQLAARLGALIEDIDDGVHESGEQLPAGA